MIKPKTRTTWVKNWRHLSRLSEFHCNFSPSLLFWVKAERDRERERKGRKEGKSHHQKWWCQTNPGGGRGGRFRYCVFPSCSLESNQGRLMISRTFLGGGCCCCLRKEKKEAFGTSKTAKWVFVFFPSFFFFPPQQKQRTPKRFLGFFFFFWGYEAKTLIEWFWARETIWRDFFPRRYRVAPK